MLRFMESNDQKTSFQTAMYTICLDSTHRGMGSSEGSVTSMATLVDSGYGSVGSPYRGTGSSARSKATVRGSYVTLMRRRGCWQRADARSGGLLDFAMEKLGIVVDVHDDEHASDGQCVEGPYIISPLADLSLNHGAHATCIPRQRLMRAEAVAIYLAQLGPVPKKAAGRLAVEFGITSKAVRDVWTGRTWNATTMPVHAQQHCNDFLPSGAVSHLAVAAAARVARALCQRPVR